MVELPQFASRKNLPTTQQKPQTSSQIYPHHSTPHPLVRGPLSPCLGLHSFHSVSCPFSFSWVFNFSFSVNAAPSALKNCKVPLIFTKTPPSNYPAPITSASGNINLYSVSLLISKQLWSGYCSSIGHKKFFCFLFFNQDITHYFFRIETLFSWTP